MSKIPRKNRDELNLLRQKWLDFYAAVANWENGQTGHIDFNYDTLRVLAEDLRTAVADLGTAVEDVDGNILEKDVFSYLRSWRLIIQMIYIWLTVPQYFSDSVEERLTRLRAITGDVGQGDPLGSPETTDQRGQVSLKSYMMSAGDTLESIAQLQMGAAERWREIVTINSLDYPYVTDDEDFETEIKSSGIVEFYLPLNAATDYVIPEGTRIATSESNDKPQLVFITQDVATITAGTKTAQVAVEAEKAGPDGNVAPFSINEVLDSLPARTGSRVAVVKAVDLAGNSTTVTRTYTGTFRARVRNYEALTGGQFLNVKKLGEFLRLPILEESRLQLILRQDDIDDEARRLFGADIYLSDDGGLSGSKSGRIEIVSGYDNLAQALAIRVNTPRGDLTYRPRYGSDFHKIIGQKSIPDWQELAELEARDAASSDPRIKEVSILNRDWAIGSGVIEIQAVPVESNSPVSVTIPTRRA